MKDLYFFRLSNGAEGFWATPTSGFGHICDEQPLPYFKYKRKDISPRLGGEEDNYEYTKKIIPLPYGKLKKPWPIKQRIFNINRKRTNIYWRNFFKSNCSRDRLFLFYSQLNFIKIKNSFLGESPLLNFERKFILKKNNLRVLDTIKFKHNLSFDYLLVNPLIKQDFDYSNILKIKTSLKPNKIISFKSSTGPAIYSSHQINNCNFSKGDELNTNIYYEFL